MIIAGFAGVGKTTLCKYNRLIEWSEFDILAKEIFMKVDGNNGI